MGSRRSAWQAATQPRRRGNDMQISPSGKDGFVPALLAAEITMRAGRDPGEIHRR